MPEIAKPWGYPLALGLMATLAGWMVYKFKKKGWM
jgi:Mg2+ and Co2+ transporter CorA